MSQDSSEFFLRFILLQDDDDDSSSDTSVGSSHGVSKLERLFYYFGLRGDGDLGPKLVYRTSTETFTPPTGPENDARVIKLLPVYDHDKLGRDKLWETVRDKVVELLEIRQILFTSVDLVRFGWDEQDADGGIKTVISRVTIWIGVQPDSTTGDVAFQSSQDILDFLTQRNIHDVDIAYRESVAKLLAGPQLYAPVDDFHPLKGVIDSVTTSLGLPIAGEKTPHMQGTFGFYFRVGDELYGVTARHVLFDQNVEANNTYTYVAGPKKKVILMGKRAFDEFLASIQAEIGILNNTVTFLGECAASYESQGEQAATRLAATAKDINEKNKAIEALKAFFVTMKKDWSDVNKRVIGHVVWAPKITGNTGPHGYTQDVCVIKLNKQKFWPNFVKNAIDLGTEIDPGSFMSLMYHRNDAQPEFHYPVDRLFKLSGILTDHQIRHPTGRDLENNPVRYVIKDGLTTGVTIGCLAGFESKVRLYGLAGTFTSVEAPVLPYGKNEHFGPFSKGGDSGALVAGPDGQFVSLLTGGTGPTDSVDITYTTPIHWLWEIIKAQFQGADLYFDDPKK